MGVDLAAGYAGRHIAKPVIGGMVDSVINRTGGPVRGPSALPPIPRTPEEYMRTMLAAKDGDISGGELARRTKLGGKDTGIRPLPEPPE